MKPFSLLLLLSISSTLSSHATSSPNCPASRCTQNGPKIRFPFYLSDPTRCGYPGFKLSCNENNKTILTLPNSGHFTVTQIDYKKQSIYINDPNHCLPNRILENINLTGSPFQAYFKQILFYKCSSLKSKDYMKYRVVPIPCLSERNNNNNNNSNFTVVVTDDYSFVPPLFTCTSFISVRVPVEMSVYKYDTWVNVTDDLMLTWHDPGCGACEAAGGNCGLKNGGTKEVECFDRPNSGLSRNVKYAITTGIGVSGLICLIWFLCYKVRAHGPNHQMGTINSYPKTILGDSGRLPMPNQGTCSICLTEYLPKQILRSIPKCNHYFHARCVDKWLKMNATCPLCRNSPSGSLTGTPSSSLP